MIAWSRAERTAENRDTKPCRGERCAEYMRNTDAAFDLGGITVMGPRYGARHLKGAGIVLAWLLVWAAMLPAFAGNTYLNDIPNVSVSEPDCHSFVITVDQASGSSATLTLRVHDVDEEAGELDKVYLNGTYLGYLSGTNDMWSTTSFDVSGVVIYGGDNTVQICIDPDGGEASTWVAEIDWGQILVDGGSAEDAEILSINASGEWNAISVSTTVQASNTDTFRLELNLLDSTNNNKDIAVDTFSLTGGSSTTRVNTVQLPSEPSGSETFTIEANLFNESTGIQQNVKTTTWTYSASEPPTDIELSSAEIQENLPAATLVGTLTAIDADSASHSFALTGGATSAFDIVGDELRTAAAFDRESQSSYDVLIRATDPDAETYSEWFTITITDENEAPSFADGASVAVSMDEDGAPTPFSLTLSASDPENDTLTWSIADQASQGTASASGMGPTKTIAYTPKPDVFGVDTFTVRIDDGRGESAEIFVEVTVAPVNDSPAAAADASSVQEAGSIAIPVLANDTDIDGDTLRLVAVSVPGQGTATAQPDDTILYVPDLGACGPDTFSYTVGDGQGGTDTATVEITIVNVLPTADTDEIETLEETVVLIPVLDNDTDPSGILVIDYVDAPEHGTARTVDGQIEYTPQLRFEGTDRFSYTISDPCGATATASVEVRVLHLNHPPTAHAGGLIQGTTGTPIELDASASSDPDTGDRLEYRWDWDGDGRFDTDWLRDPKLTVVYDEPVQGQLTLEVRDLYQGLPTGDVSRATAMIRIGSVQSITLVVFEDIDGDGHRSEGEPGVPGVDILLQSTRLTTDDDGRITFGTAPGVWTFTMDAASIEALQAKDFEVLTDALEVPLGAGDEVEASFAVRKTAGRLRGTVFIDLNEDGVFDEGDRPAPGLQILLNGDEEAAVLTDARGTFAFSGVPFGEWNLTVREPAEEGEEEPAGEGAAFLEVAIVHARVTEEDLLIPWLRTEEEADGGTGFLNVEVGAEKDN